MAVTDWTTNAYPRPRSNRRTAAVPSDDSGFLPEPPPKVSNFAWHMQEAGVGERCVLASQRFIGPAIIKRMLLDIRFSLVGGNRTPIFQVWWQASPPAEGKGLPRALPVGVNLLFDAKWSREAGFITDPGQPGISLGLGDTVTRPYELNFNYPVSAPEFYVAVSIVTEQAPTGGDAHGMLSVIEQVAFDRMAALLT